MKLPKNFGKPSGMANMMAQAQEAMKKAQDLEKQLAKEEIEVVKGPVSAVFNGAGEMVRIKIDPSIVNPEDVEMLEDLIVSATRDGLEKASQMKATKMQEIMPNIPGLPGF